MLSDRNGALITFKVGPLYLHTISPPFLPMPKTLLEGIFWCLSSTKFLYISSLLSERDTFNGAFDLRNKQKSHMAMAGELGDWRTTGIECLNQGQWMSQIIDESYNIWWISRIVSFSESPSFDKIGCRTFTQFVHSSWKKSKSDEMYDSISLGKRQTTIGLLDQEKKIKHAH